LQLDGAGEIDQGLDDAIEAVNLGIDDVEMALGTARYAVAASPIGEVRVVPGEADANHR